MAILDHAPAEDEAELAGDLDQEQTGGADAPGRLLALAGRTPWASWAGDEDAQPSPEDGDRPAAYGLLARLAREEQNSSQLPAGR